MSVKTESTSNAQTATPDDAPARMLDTQTPGVREMLCPICEHAMPDLKGGKASICPVCGFKDSCCY